jgi:hypothetical protein
MFCFASRVGKRPRVHWPDGWFHRHLTALPAQFFETRTDYCRIVSRAGAGHVSSVSRRELCPSALAGWDRARQLSLRVLKAEVISGMIIPWALPLPCLTFTIL